MELLSEDGTLWGKLSGKLRFQRDSGDREPITTGDWVLFRNVPGADFVLVEDTLPRINLFKRQEAGGRTAPQAIAANLDSLLICTGLDRDYNLNRIERYLVLAWESGIKPVLVFTKADLSEDLAMVEAEVIGRFPEIPRYFISSYTRQGLDTLRPLLQAGSTLALIGSSGCGKSTLLNALTGSELQETGRVRESDGRGRHTTTHRSLHKLPGGALVVDNPGLREVQLWDEGAGEDNNPFGDIEEWITQCRFSDCGHQTEPGCAVQAALDRGDLERERFEEYLRLQKELTMTRQKRKQQKEAWGKEIAKFSRQLRKDRGR